MLSTSTSLSFAIALFVPLVAADGPVAVRPPAATPTVAVAPAARSTASRTPSGACDVSHYLRPPLYRIPLKATGSVAGAEGTAVLQPASTLFGVSVTVDGHHRFLVEVTTRGLPTPNKLGAYKAYVAWAARSDLSRVVKLGALDSQGRASGDVAFQKFIVFVTAERSADAVRQAGPILLQGLSPSGQMKNMLTEPLLNGGMPPC